MAFDKLKGISLSIKLDTREYKNSISEIKRDLKLLNNDVKEWKKALEINPSDTETLRRYDEALKELGDRAEAERKRLKALYDEMLAEGYSSSDPRLTSTIDQLKDIDKIINKTIPDYKDFSDNIVKGNSDIAESFEEANEGSSNFYSTLSAILTGDVIRAGLNLLGNAISKVWNGIKKLASGYFDLVKQGVEYNASMEKYTVSLRAIAEANGESSKSADKLIKKMKEIGRTSSFGTSALLESAQQLAASGLSMEEATTSITNLQKLLAYAGKGDDELSRMAQNLNQIKNAGKATSVDLKQFAYAGIPVYKLLADSNAKFNKITKETVVTYEDLAKAFGVAFEAGSQYFAANEIQLSTFGGQINQLKSQWEMLLGKLTENTTSTLSTQILPTVNGFFGDLIKAFETNESNAQLISDGLYWDIFTPSKDISTVFKEGIGEVIQSVIDSDIVFDFLEMGVTFLEAINTAFDPNTDEGKENLEKLNKLIDKFSGEVCKLLTNTNIIQKFKDVGGEIADAVAQGFFNGLPDIVYTGLDPRGQITSRGGGRGSAGFGFESGGFSNQITLNASFVANGQLDEAQAQRFASLMAEQINKELGGNI